MPLHSIKSLFKDKSLLLPTELPGSSFSVTREEGFIVSMDHAWLSPTFDQNVLWVPDSEEAADFKAELAQFLNERAKGPFYVFEGTSNAHEKLSVVLFDKQDIDAFARNFPRWKFNPEAEAENAETLKVWKTCRSGLDKRLDQYTPS